MRDNAPWLVVAVMMTVVAAILAIWGRSCTPAPDALPPPPTNSTTPIAAPTGNTPSLQMPSLLTGPIGPEIDRAFGAVAKEGELYWIQCTVASDGTAPLAGMRLSDRTRGMLRALVPTPDGAALLRDGLQKPEATVRWEGATSGSRSICTVEAPRLVEHQIAVDWPDENVPIPVTTCHEAVFADGTLQVRAYAHAPCTVTLANPSHHAVLEIASADPDNDLKMDVVVGALDAKARMQERVRQRAEEDAAIERALGDLTLPRGSQTVLREWLGTR